MSFEHQRQQPSIIERIKSAGKYLEVSKAEIQNEMTRLYKEGDTKGIIEMFTAYRDWELRGALERKDQRTQNDIIALAMRNFDFVARVADSSICVTSNDTVSAIVMSTEDSSNIIGSIRQFYRDAIGYNPQLINSRNN